MGKETRTADGHTNSAQSTAFTNARNLDPTQASLTLPHPQLNWDAGDDGWIVQIHTNNRIMWLPDIITSYLYRPTNTLIIATHTATLDLARAESGSKWALCYTP
ncbi:hypothetical protein DL96DRAFT_1589682 [Flagelloscypha sp. PMI_526]|nr:hypothetical protein DL96DRAFT_1589682 [Flagelloscypha sp. PMI_526]